MHILPPSQFYLTSQPKTASPSKKVNFGLEMPIYSKNFNFGVGTFLTLGSFVAGGLRVGLYPESLTQAAKTKAAIVDNVNIGAGIAGPILLGFSFAQPATNSWKNNWVKKSTIAGTGAVFTAATAALYNLRKKLPEETKANTPAALWLDIPTWFTGKAASGLLANGLLGSFFKRDSVFTSLLKLKQ